MITKKEMGYVNSWPNRTPYPGEEYSVEIMDKLKKCYELFNDKYLNRRYTIQFSNNEEIEFEILDRNLAHILGVDYKNLMKDIFDNYRQNILRLNPHEQVSSYGLLTAVIESADDILEYDRSKKACLGLNYYRIGIKCDIFSKLADLSNFHYGCINFDKSIYDTNNPEKPFSSQSNKFLYTPSDETISPYFMMGLKIDDHNTDEHIVETLIACDDPYRFFVGQEVVIPTQILTDDEGILDKKTASSAEKIKLLREYQNIVNMYRIPNNINIYGDYFSMLMGQKNDDEKTLSLK